MPRRRAQRLGWTLCQERGQLGGASWAAALRRVKGRRRAAGPLLPWHSLLLPPKGPLHPQAGSSASPQPTLNQSEPTPQAATGE